MKRSRDRKTHKCRERRERKTGKRGRGNRDIEDMKKKERQTQLTDGDREKDRAREGEIQTDRQRLDHQCCPHKSR